MFYRSEKVVFKLLNKSNAFRRYNFLGIGDYFDFIFLCGKAISENDNRHFIKEQLKRYKKFSLFSEYLYKEFNDIHVDLLKIEDILLSVCAGTILIVESYGSACELGAFSFISKNIKKLWVINNKEYKDNDSFIEQGPLKKISDINEKHVIYEKFKDGVIDYSGESYRMFKTVGREGGFSSGLETYYSETKTCQLNDLGFVLCLLFDYVRLFGFIIESHVIEVLKILYSKYEIDKFSIKLPSSESIVDEKAVKAILTKILVILERAKVLKRKLHKDDVYYTLDYDTMKTIDKNPNEFDSFIFVSKFFNSTLLRKELAKISNIEVKEGFNIW